ncbi:VWA domain-containing protein [Occallatibacter savannae]|uniref:VWA domain-containing protein n=1 Tax=Occallatibacter savannae TaxID=1002691 RepID=UPI000D696AB7|nr:VWA domain-containing protein [Occallatibacter savannae]
MAGSVPGKFKRGQCVAILFLAALAFPIGAQSDKQDKTKQEPPDPTLSQRPAPRPQSLLIPEGKIKLDVVVNDTAGDPVLGLEPWDFKILDNGQPRKVLSFRKYDGVQTKPDPPVEVVLVIDMLNLPFQQVAYVRTQLDAFLRQNGGKLKQPVSVAQLTDAGLRVQPRPSTDGNAIASVVAGIKEHVSTINPAMGGEGWVERFQRSARAMDNIAQNQLKKPGRKLVIWIGPGWPLLNRPSDGYTDKQQRRNFDSIVELSTALREARVTMYSVSPVLVIQNGPNPMLYKRFLNPVRTAHDAEAGDLGLKVLVTQTGGKIMGPDNDMVAQINRCIDDANAFYRISFDPPAAEQPDEYHDLKIAVAKPGTTVRTNTGYYDQPANR